MTHHLYADYYADFYVTCATVIPVLFLVVAVRAGRYESELANKKVHGIQLLLAIAYGSVVLASVGEFGALLQLLLRQDRPVWRAIVFATTLLLLLVVLFSPSLGWWRAITGKVRVNPPSVTDTDP
jgi:hypothetical protein